MKTNLINHFNKLQVKIKNPKLLETALTHRSYLNEQRQSLESNERFEYLGDAVLELITSEFLFHKFLKKPEGELTSLRAKIVQTKTLGHVAQKLELGSYLRLSKGEAASGGAQNTSILADTFEAVIGAIYLDQGLSAARTFVRTYLLNNFEKIILNSAVQDYKSRLQELVQSKDGNSPTYELLSSVGPDHDCVFTISVSYFDKEQAKGKGKSKQAAEQQAAKNALEKLTANK